jgi:vacuolar-type H+-ATPase subunit E/Vma4
MENWTKIVEIHTAAAEDAEKFFEKGNKAAGTRLRKAYKEISDLCKDGRKEVSEMKNS